MPRATVLDKLAIGAVQSTSVARHLASSLPDGFSREGPITGRNARAHLYDIYNNTSLSCTPETASFFRPAVSKLRGRYSPHTCIK